MHALWSESLAMLLSLVFGAAAAGKFLAYGAWPGVVANFRVLPRALVTPVAWSLPPLEGAIALALPVDALRSVAAAAAAALLVVFAAALAVNLARGRRHIDCGCFRSDLRQDLSPALLVRNALLAGAALALVPGGSYAGLPLAAHTIAAGAALSLFLCYLSVGILFRPARAAHPA